MDRNKLAAYFGFAKRAGKLSLGVNAVAAQKRVFLLAADEGASPNTKKEIEKLRARFSCPLIRTEELGALVAKEGCRIAAVRDEALAKAILAAAQGTREEFGR